MSDSVLSPRSSILPRRVPEHAAAECAPLVRFIRTRQRKGGIGEDVLDGWVRQATNGQTEHLRACSRYELCCVADMLRLRLGERPRRFRRGAAASAFLAGARLEPGTRSTEPGTRRDEREARQASGVVELPTLAQLQMIWAVAGELRLADDELRGIALKALGLPPLQRAWRTEAETTVLRLRKTLPNEPFGMRKAWPWRTKQDAGHVIDALLDIRRRRWRAAAVPEAPGMREPGEEG